MRIILKWGGVIAYYLFGYFLPNNETPLIGKFCRIFRYVLCSLFTIKIGKNVNIQRKVYLGRTNVIIGNNSGLGANMVVHGIHSLTIGNNVMSAPDILILGSGHNFKTNSISDVRTAPLSTCLCISGKSGLHEGVLNMTSKPFNFER